MSTEHTNQSSQTEPVKHSPIALQSIPKRQRDFTAENIRDIAHECMRIGDNEQAEVVFAIADALRDGNLTIHPAAVAVRIRELEAQLNAAILARREAQQVAQEAIEARNGAGVEIRRPLLKRIRELQAQHGELLSWITHIQGAALDLQIPRSVIHAATVNAIAGATKATTEDSSVVQAGVAVPAEWPTAQDVGRIGDMSQVASLRVGLDADNDVYVCIHGEAGSGSVEFCVPGSGGGKSPRTRAALIALMVAMEADNAETPSRDWWKAREGDEQKGGEA